MTVEAAEPGGFPVPGCYRVVRTPCRFEAVEAQREVISISACIPEPGGVSAHRQSCQNAGFALREGCHLRTDVTELLREELVRHLVRPVLFGIGFRSNCTMQLKAAQETLPSSQILIGSPIKV